MWWQNQAAADRGFFSGIVGTGCVCVCVRVRLLPKINHHRSLSPNSVVSSLCNKMTETDTKYAYYASCWILRDLIDENSKKQKTK